MTLKGELIAVGEAVLSAEEIMVQPRGLAINVKKVFMEAHADKIEEY